MLSSGKMDKDIERLHRLDIGAAKTEAPSLRYFPVKLSNPALLAGFISSKSFCTALVVVGWRENYFSVKSKLNFCRL